ncbi:MAG TPA: oligosaccharide flippase family protein [Pyrinomonadaceae bacterium]|nr:oligosaccharide flippase family protein [Pyrinomonadaceae bacterium]
MASEAASRTSRMAANTVFSLAAWFLPLVIGFFATPILVRYLGNENYGLYAVITGFMAYSFSFGVGKVAGKYVAEYQAAGEIDKISPVVSATFAFTLAVAIVGTIVLASLARVIVADVLLITGKASNVAVTSLYLACAISMAIMLSQIYQYVLQGLQRFGAFLVLTNLNGLLLGIGSIIIVISGGYIVGLLVWNLTVAVVTAALFFITARIYLPSLRLVFHFDRKTVRSVVNYGSSIIVYQVFANILFIFERALVMRKFGAEALAFYSVPMMLAIYLHSFIGSFALVLFPVVNELLSDQERQIELYQKASKIIVAIVVFVVTTFICTGRTGLLIWINADYAANSYNLLVLHSLTFGLIAIMIVAWQLAEGFRHAKINALTTAFWLVIAVPAMLFAARYYGPDGIAAARLLSVILSVPVMFYVERRFLGRSFWRFWAAVSLRVGIAAVVAGLIEMLALRTFSAGWTALALAGTAGVMVYALVLIASGYFTRDERALLLGLLTRKFRGAAALG